MAKTCGECVVCDVAYTPEPRFQSRLPRWPHLMNILLNGVGACSACCQGFCLCNLWLLRSFIFIFPLSLRQSCCAWRWTWTVTRTFTFNFIFPPNPLHSYCARRGTWTVSWTFAFNFAFPSPSSVLLCNRELNFNIQLHFPLTLFNLTVHDVEREQWIELLHVNRSLVFRPGTNISVKWAFSISVLVPFV